MKFIKTIIFMILISNFTYGVSHMAISTSTEKLLTDKHRKTNAKLDSLRVLDRSGLKQDEIALLNKKKSITIIARNSSVDSAFLNYDGKDLGFVKLPYLFLDVSEGLHKVTMKNEWGVESTKQMYLYPGTMHICEIETKQPTGGIVFKSFPDSADIWINGYLVGLTPMNVTGLSAGDYDCVIYKKGYNGHKKDIPVKTGFMAQANVSLTEEISQSSRIFNSFMTGLVKNVAANVGNRMISTAISGVLHPSTIKMNGQTYKNTTPVKVVKVKVFNENHSYTSNESSSSEREDVEVISDQTDDKVLLALQNKYVDSDGYQQRLIEAAAQDSIKSAKLKSRKKNRGRWR